MAKEDEAPRTNPAEIENLIEQIRGTNLEPGAKDEITISEASIESASRRRHTGSPTEVSRFGHKRLMPNASAIRIT